jgi:hypothetical protein
MTACLLQVERQAAPHQGIIINDPDMFCLRYSHPYNPA